ncbi:serine/threonine-protein kinase [Actinoplanes sp. NPDC051343]|uniref:serine/threonine-protein kinase n=1 Tax=Actinoplanes sp. NPDC051343 TaxID=3363906 RepID=UPI00378F157F
MAVRRMLVAGRYRLREPVGTGGMGRVWLARDEMLDRDVAVKEFVPPEWMTDEEKARLKDRTLREARSAARLNHPNVVQIYDVVHADGLPWIVMEYVPSRSLHQVLSEDGAFSPAAAARVGLHVLDALTAAHEAGVLHRDIKPHNVLIGEGGRVVLTDFGLATFVDDGSVTGPGLIVGSPQYVSPERARDGASTVESDLWSFGATLYAAVEGRSPYARESAMATLMALATEPPDPPELAGLLAPVLTGLLRHDPEARLTAPEVDRRLRMILATADGEPAVVDRERALTVPAPRPRRRDQEHAEVAAMSGAPATPAARSVNQALVRAVPAQRTSSGPVSPAPAGADAAPEAPPRPRFSLVAAVLTAVAVLGAAGIVTGYLIQRDDEHAAAMVFPPVAAQSTAPVPSSRAPAVGGFSPAACTGTTSADAPETPQKNASRGVNGWALYEGWSYFTDGTGFHMPVPDRWTYQKVGTTYCFRDPDGGRLMTLDVGRKPSSDPLQACRKEAARLVAAGAFPGYHLIQLDPRPLLNKAADWEYQYTAPDKTVLHVQTRWFATNGKAYAISWQARELDWSGDFAKISMVLSTFYADRK